MDQLGTWDYVVFAASLIMSAAIGVYYGIKNKEKTNAEYLLASGDMNVWVVSVSLMASFMSAITLLGVPAEIYSSGLMFFYINVSYMIGTPICAFFFLPVFFNLKCTSAYEYLGMRFSTTVRTVASVTFMLQMILYMGIVLYAPALALSAVTGLSKWWSIITVGLVCTFYCTTGGMKAVLWTDFLQSGLMFAALILVTVCGIVQVGGIGEVYDRALAGGRLEMSGFDIDPTTRHSFFSLALGGVFIYCSIYGVNQTQVQRLLTVSSLREAQVALFVSWPITSLLSACCCLTGIVMYAFFKDCDPMQSDASNIKSPDQLLPFFMIKVVGSVPALPGLFVAGIFSGALSSVSSFVNSLAAVTLEDLIKPALSGTRCLSSKRAESLLTKGIAAAFGLLCLLLAFLAEQMTGILVASLTIFGVVGGPLLALFTLGMMSKTCSSNAALTAFLVSLAVGFWLAAGALLADLKPATLPLSTSHCPVNHNISESSKQIFNESNSSPNASHDEVFYLYRLSYMYLSGITFFIEVIVALLLSKLFWPNTRHLSNNLISPLFRRHDHEGEIDCDRDSFSKGSPATQRVIPMSQL